MEISQAWAPMVTEEEIKKEGTLLNESLLVEPDMGGAHKLKIYCKLYYLKHKDLFVTVLNDFVTINDVHPIQVVTDFKRMIEFRETYLGQMNVDSTTDFTEMDTTEYPIFKSEVDIQDIEMVKKYGRFLEKRYGSADIYYIESIDAFVIDSGQTVAGSLPRVPFQNNDLRKKYNIPFQDERFETLSFN